MRHLFIGLCMLFGFLTPAVAQLSISFATPGVSIGINLPVYPRLVRVPGYPVYYAPGLNSNYFFYDGLYWSYIGDNWYASSWYNGPWGLVDPFYVPVYILRVPVRYYRHPPTYFQGWRVDNPPRWGEHWGQSWEQRRSGWDRWNRRSVPAPAPLPSYQRQYSGDRYPQATLQADIQIRQYRYQPRDPVAQEHFRQQRAQQPQQRRQSQQAPAQRQQQSQQMRQPKQAPAAQSSREFAPGQVRKDQGAQSSREFAPGRVKKDQGAQSAREFAPGQQGKEQRTSGGSSRAKDDDKDHGRGNDEGRGGKRDK